MAVKTNVYETQATWSVILGAVASLAMLAAAAAVLQKFQLDDFEIVLRAGGGRYYAILGAIGLAGAASLIGSLIGFSSAGHKRNKKSNLSWMGFFVNAVVMTLTLCLFVFFWLTKDTMQMPQ